MYCAKCGAKLPENANHCPNCGASVGSGFEKMEQFGNDVTDTVDSETNEVIDSVGNAFNSTTNQQGIRLLRTDRSLLVYVLLNLITCGIYNFFFIHSLAKDVNVACVDDGEKTPGVGMFIFMTLIGIGVGLILGIFTGTSVQRIVYEAQSGNVISVVRSAGGSAIPTIIVSIITGIYPLYWRYKLGDKLQRNGQQYGLMIPENGSTIIIWDILGIVCCCFCSWYAIYIIIKNSNTICTAYNNKYVLNQS